MTVVPELLATEMRERGFAIWPAFASPTECAAVQLSTANWTGGKHGRFTRPTAPAIG